MTSRPSNWLYEERRLREVGGVAEDPLRFARPTVEGEEPERERGGVFMDIMADWKITAEMERFGQPPGLLRFPFPRRHTHTHGVVSWAGVSSRFITAKSSCSCSQPPVLSDHITS